MKTIAIAMAAVFAATAATAVYAQSATPTPPAPSPATKPTDDMSKPASMNEVEPASFRFQMGDVRIEVHCGTNEPVKACVEAATMLIDRSVSVAERGDDRRSDTRRDDMDRAPYRR